MPYFLLIYSSREWPFIHNQSLSLLHSNTEDWAFSHNLPQIISLKPWLNGGKVYKCSTQNKITSSATGSTLFLFFFFFFFFMKVHKKSRLVMLKGQGGRPVLCEDGRRQKYSFPWKPASMVGWSKVYKGRKDIIRSV